MTLTSIIQMVTGLINVTIGIATVIALFFFFWNVFQAFGKTDNVEKRAEARQSIVWSLIAIFVIVSLGGIIAVFSATFPDLRGGGGGGGGTSALPSTGGGGSFAAPSQTVPLTPANSGDGPVGPRGPTDIAP